MERARHGGSRVGFERDLDSAECIIRSISREETMLKKRRMLLSLGAASLATGTLGLTAGVARAQARPLTFCSGGGALSDMEKATMLEPFGKLKKVDIAYASPTNYAK